MVNSRDMSITFFVPLSIVNYSYNLHESLTSIEDISNVENFSDNIYESITGIEDIFDIAKFSDSIYESLTGIEDMSNHNQRVFTRALDDIRLSSFSTCEKAVERKRLCRVPM